MIGRAMERPPPTFKGIREVFYETRVLKGRDWTLRRFASELGIDPVLLGYIEKGERFPNEDLVRKLAALRGDDPRDLLGILHRDRIVRVLAREIRRALAGSDEGAAEQADPESTPPASFSVVLSRALSALPDDGSPMALGTFRKTIRAALESTHGKATRTDAQRVEKTLARKKLIAVGSRDVRKLARHIHAVTPDERLDLALEFAAIFAKSLTDKIVRENRDTYLKNHFLTVAPERLESFRKRLDQAIQDVVREFSVDERAPVGRADRSPGDFVRVLVAGTRKE